jgi:ABC-2 type transport system ATP-binding protein
MALLVENINKSFSNVQVISDLSMEVLPGEIFGFLGPNGAGKTTTMRMILDILRPDTGQITWEGRPVSQVPRRFWGYLPEERGLYPKMMVEDQLIFLARLYGISRDLASKRLTQWLARFQIEDYRKKKVEELSKGNQQKIQVLAALLHDPEILIMDEPFSGLDPVNVSLLKEAFLELHQQGKTIIFSTHQMEQVEELCQNIVIINKGRMVVEGNVRAVKRSAGRRVLHLAMENDSEIGWLDLVPGVRVTKRRQDYVEVQLASEVDPNRILQLALQRGGRITLFELADPSLTDIFIERVGQVNLPSEPVRSDLTPATV